MNLTKITISHGSSGVCAMLRGDGDRRQLCSVAETLGIGSIMSPTSSSESTIPSMIVQIGELHLRLFISTDTAPSM